MPVACPSVHGWTDEDAFSQARKGHNHTHSCAASHHDHDLVKAFAEQLDHDEFLQLEAVGYGYGGMVYKSIHVPSNTVVARKIFNSRIPSENRRKLLQRELLTLQKCCSPYILHYYGAIVSEFQVSLVLEYMDLGSLSDILHSHGPLPEAILGKIAFNVLKGLLYLCDDLNMIHRDLKPSNILVNSLGEVKLCDFGDSVELINSKASSVVGTMGYMAPERIQGQYYTVTSDIWSLGVTLMELSTGLFPFAYAGEVLRPRSDETEYGLDSIAIMELYESITTSDLPSLDPAYFSTELRDFVNICMTRDPTRRPAPMNLLVHPFILKHKDLDLASWVKTIQRISRE